MKIIRKIEVRLRYLYWAAKRIKQPKLFDFAYYNGIKCVLIQGVYDPYWDLLPPTSYYEPGEKVVFKKVHRDEFSLSKMPQRYLFALRSDYRFQMRNWYKIDKRNPIGTRISYIDKSDIKFWL